MLRPCPPVHASLSAVLAGLLAVTALTQGAPQAQAQKSAGLPNATAHRVSPTAPTAMTPLKVLNGEAIRLGHYEPTNKMRLVLTIKPPHMPEEEQFINELVTKGSPNFHKFLTPEQWNARFAPSVEDEQRVVAWAESQGFKVVQRYPNRLLVVVDGTADTVEKAFNVTMNKYQVGPNVEFSNDRDPLIPSSLEGVLGNVLGLSSVERPHRLGSRKATLRTPDYASGPMVSPVGGSHADGNPEMSPLHRAAAQMADKSTTSKVTPADTYPLDYKGGYAMDPANVQSSQGYDLNALQRLSHCCNEWGQASGSPPESSIALVGYGNVNGSDISTFFGAYGMAYNWGGWCIGGGSCPAVDGEAPLDLEYSGAMSNSYGDWHATAHVYLYEMDNNLYSTYSAAFNQIISDGVAKVVSTSYGWEENVGFSGSVATGTMHPIFNNMVGVGITLISASGDSGASVGCDSVNHALYPATDPDFIAAGGTQLSLNTDGTFYSEQGWQGETWSGACGSNHGGSSGGPSVLFVAPAWQNTQAGSYYGWQGSTEYIFTGGNGRLTPDISMTANPDVLGQWYYSGGSWQDEGGTSIVAPELAGFFAQENSYLDWVGNVCGSGSTACSPVGNAAPFIYYNGNSGAPHNPFYDTTGGWDGSGGCSNNDDTAYWGLYYYCTYSGWDPVTGWGSANLMQLAWGINWELIPAYGQPYINFSGPATNVWYNTNQEVSWGVGDYDSSGNGYPAPGVAGFTQGWDSIPSDPYSEPNGGDGNSFYWGPQFPFATAGCLAVNSNGVCAYNGSPEGCHTAYVEAWDNQGRTSTSSYGPVCFDDVAPNIAIATNPVIPSSGWLRQSATVTLTASDPGGGNASGIYKTYYAFDTGSCYPTNTSACYVYSGPFTDSAAGQHYIYYFTVDNAGNASSEPYLYINIDEVPPITSANLAGTVYSGSTYKTPVAITLSATDNSGGSGVFHKYYQLDGGSTLTYTGSAFIVNTVGSHTLKYWSKDVAGNVETVHSLAFSILSQTTTALTATPNPSLVSQKVKLTATVTPKLAGTPTGTVTFYYGSTSLGAGTLSSGVATLVTTALPPGTLTLKAVYAGAGNFLGSTSAGVSETVDKFSVLTAPAPSSVLVGPSVTFTWTAPTGATGYALRLGTTLGGNDIYGSGVTTATSVTRNNLPTNGGTVYARLQTFVGSSTVYKDYTFTAATRSALTTPAPGSTLAGSTVTFSWTAAAHATGYVLKLGTTVGGSDLYNPVTTTATSATVHNLPTNGSTIHARLITEYGSVWVYTDYTYTAQ